MSVGIRYVDDSHAAGALVNRQGFRTPSLDPRIGVKAAEPFVFVMGDDGAAAFTDDHPLARLLDDRAAAFGAFVTLMP
jgi:hypothetical protein